MGDADQIESPLPSSLSSELRYTELCHHMINIVLGRRDDGSGLEGWHNA